MSLIYPLPNRNTVDLYVPTFTLDVNQVSIRAPFTFDSDQRGLVGLEWNYFEEGKVELCVTPATELEITQGTTFTNLGSAAQQRLLKSELYKRRPEEVLLNLSPSDSDALWLDMRHLLFPTVTDFQMTSRQVADVHQVFLHTISSGSTASNSVFVTRDGNFNNNSQEFQDRYGVTILDPNQAWSMYQPQNQLVVPSRSQANDLWERQQQLFGEITSASA